MDTRDWRESDLAISAWNEDKLVKWDQFQIVWHGDGKSPLTVLYLYFLFINIMIKSGQLINGVIWKQCTILSEIFLCLLIITAWWTFLCINMITIFTLSPSADIDFEEPVMRGEVFFTTWRAGQKCLGTRPQRVPRISRNPRIFWKSRSRDFFGISERP